MHAVLETLAAPFFAIIDFALATPTAAMATTSVVGIAIVAIVVARAGFGVGTRRVHDGSRPALMGSMRVLTIMLLALLTAVASPARGAGNKAPTERFLEQAAARSLAAIEFSDLALQRTDRAAVRRLARRTVTEQAQAYETILGLATGAGSTAAPPATLDLEQRGIKSRLASLRGADFDRAYVHALRINESRDIALYRAYSRDGREAALKAWAADQLQKIRQRQQLIEATALEVPPR